MEKLEKYLDKEKLANSGGDISIIQILDNTLTNIDFNSHSIEDYDKIKDLIELLYRTNNLMILAEENHIASEYYNEIYNLYHKIKLDTAKLIGYEKLWEYKE